MMFSSVLLININQTDVGGIQGACNPLLQTMFETTHKMHDQMVAQRVQRGERTLLQFIVRNYKNDSTLPIMKQKLEEIVDHAWLSVHNPNAHNTLTRHNMFDVEVYLLQNFVPGNVFHAELLGDLPALFHTPTHPKNVFRNRDVMVFEDMKEVAAVGELMWDKIEKNEQLEMDWMLAHIAQDRCEKVLKSAKALMTAGGEELYQHIEAAHMVSAVNLCEEAKALVVQVQRMYAENAPHRFENLYENVHAKMNTELKQCYGQFERRYSLFVKTIEPKLLAAERAIKAQAVEDEQKQEVKRKQDELAELQIQKDMNAAQQVPLQRRRARNEITQEQFQTQTESLHEINAMIDQQFKQEIQMIEILRQAEKEQMQREVKYQRERALLDQQNREDDGGGCVIL